MGFLSKRQKMGAAAILLAISAFVSRLMGLARDKIISWQFGASGEADMYFAAFVIPDMINYLLAGAFMSITIIPMLGRGFETEPDEAWRFFSCVALWMLIVSTACALGCEIMAPALAAIVAPGFTPEQCLRLALFMRIILPAQIFFLTGACFTALLLLRGQFAVPALSPVIYNGSIILFGLGAPLFVPADMLAEFGMAGYCVGVTIGAAIGAFALPARMAWRGGMRLSLVWHHAWMRKFLMLALPLMLGQTVVMLDEQFLRVFGSMIGEGAVSLLNYARRIAQVPVALMGQAIAVASYPFLVKLLAKNDHANFDETMRAAIIGGLQLIIPCAALMIAASRPILGLIFEGGRFGAGETLACAPLAAILLAAAPLWIFYMVIARGYYAHGDTLTPAITGTIITIICIPCYYFWAVPHGSAAITIISGLGIGAYALWLGLIWRKRYGAGPFAGLRGQILKSLLCSLPAAAAAWGAAKLAGLIPLAPLLVQLAEICAAGLAFCCVFTALAIHIDPAPLKKFLALAKRFI